MAASTKKKTETEQNTEQTEPIVSAPVAPVFTKQNILTFSRYAGRRDLLSVLLDEKEYTMEQVDKLLHDFFRTKGKVN